MTYINDVYLWATARLSLGIIFIWAFMDKLFGLGFSTPRSNAWINGVSPTTGFLSHGTKGIFAPFFHLLAGNTFVDWLFMLGLIGIGFSLISGIATKISGQLGAILMVLMWLAVFPSQNNPIIDEHIVYAIVLMGISTTTIRSEDYYGLGKWWKKISFIQNHSFLE